MLNLEVSALLTSSEVCGITVQILADTNGLSCGVKNKLWSGFFLLAFLPAKECQLKSRTLSPSFLCAAYLRLRDDTRGELLKTNFRIMAVARTSAEAQFAAAFFQAIKVTIISVLLLKQALWKYHHGTLFQHCRAKERQRSSCA